MAPLLSPGEDVQPVGLTTLPNLCLVAGEAPVATSIWYPAANASAITRYRYSRAFVGQVALNAPPLAERKRALCVLVHGLRGTLNDLSWLGESLAQAGLVAVAFEQPGVCYKTFDAILAPKLWRRALQIQAVIDAMWQEPRFAPLVAGKSVLLAGHSAGVSAALLLAGAEFSPALFLARYGKSGPVPGPIAPDPRVRAVLAMAPGTGEVFADEGMARVRTPCLIFSGDRDRVCPDRYNAARYAANIPDVAWHRIGRAGHFVFKPTCSWYGKLRAPGICLDAFGVDRDAVHSQVSQETLALLRQRKLLPTG